MPRSQASLLLTLTREQVRGALPSKTQGGEVTSQDP